MPLGKMRNVALIATLLVPLGLLHAWVFAEICIAVTDVLFLVESGRNADFTWARKPWFMVAMLWWVWLMFCSLPLPALGLITAGWQLSFVQALVIIRMFIFAAALQNWVLTTASARRLAWLMVALSCLWIGVESWQQYITGTNLFGDHRWGDGSLTGPFRRPRAGALYGHLLFVSMLPPALAMLSKPGSVWRIGAILLAALGVVTSVLIGQRMGTIFTVLGLAGTAVFIPQLRRVAVAIVVVAVLVLLATPIISPPTYTKLVGETYRNLHHFTLSPYGELYTRATVMGLASPWHGWGYNGFRAFCPQPQFAAGLPALGIVPTQLGLGACNLHPHNFYFQAFSDAGFPGLVLFVTMILIWLGALFRGLRQTPDPLRVGLFIAVVTFVWPFGSSDEFPVLYMSGWLFLLLGIGLATADAVPHSTKAAIV